LLSYSSTFHQHHLLPFPTRRSSDLAINFLADLTNYLMLEMGQPMHAFDSRKVEKLRIKRFPKPFEFQTLDGVERHIDENTLMIRSEEHTSELQSRFDLVCRLLLEKK